VHAQQVATFRGENQLVADWGSLGSPDEFDRWNLERDRRDDRIASSRTAEYVSPDVTGYEDLDDNGTWSSEPEYGYVWTPSRVVVGWSPYRYGRWVWVSPWGWTWIDDAPWGYAPFHYGRWAHVRNRWCWVPGPRHVRAVYAPALVGWVGSPGLNVSVSVGSGVGWFPLGPREVYVPHRRYSHRYVERVNVSNTVIVNRTYLNDVYANGGRNVAYRNRNVPGGFTVVSRDTFISARRTGDPHARIDERAFARGNVSNSPHLLPARESRYGGRPSRDVRVPPRTVVDRQVIVKREPPPANARFARTRGDVDTARAPSERFQQRPPDRDRRDNDQRLEGSRDSRPIRGNPPVVSQPNVPQATPEQRTFQDRAREDRPPKQRDQRGDDRSFERVRERQANQQQAEAHTNARQREEQSREQQQAEAQQRWRQRDDQQRNEQQQRELRQRAQQQQEREQQNRERFQRQQDSERQSSARQFEARQAEARQRNEDRQRDVQRQQQERQQQEQRQQQDRQRSEPRPVYRGEPRNDKPRAAPRDQDDPRPNRK
jgi:flagellar biosynthesis GTPase FlhF